MYQLSDEQIEFILSDIRNRGVAMEDLQQNLLDHICCIIESELTADGNFDAFYQDSIRRFYTKELKEIETETVFLLTYKNYYAMKKVMLISGTFSAIVTTIGIFFKFNHWAGANVMMVLGILCFSLLFLPLMFLLKLKDVSSTSGKEGQDSPMQKKALIIVNALVAIFICMGTLFKVMHWPGATMLGVSSVALLTLVYLPLYFFHGIRKPETKLNTITTSIILLAGSGIFLTLARSPIGSKMFEELQTKKYLQYEALLDHHLQQINSSNTQANPTALACRQLIDVCEHLKADLLKAETGVPSLEESTVQHGVTIGQTYTHFYFQDNNSNCKRLEQIESMVETLNEKGKTNPDWLTIPVKNTILDNSEERITDALVSLVRVELFAAENLKGCNAQVALK